MATKKEKKKRKTCFAIAFLLVYFKQVTKNLVKKIYLFFFLNLHPIIQLITLNTKPPLELANPKNSLLSVESRKKSGF